MCLLKMKMHQCVQELGTLVSNDFKNEVFFGCQNKMIKLVDKMYFCWTCP